VAEENKIVLKQLLEKRAEKQAELFPPGIVANFSCSLLPKTPVIPPCASPPAQPQTRPTPEDASQASVIATDRISEEKDKAQSNGAGQLAGEAAGGGGGWRGENGSTQGTDSESVCGRERERESERQRERHELEKSASKAKEEAQAQREEEEQDPTPIVARGNKHLQTTWGKPQPKRSAVSFRIGNEKVDMPLLLVPRAQPPPCYRAWTTITRNMTAEDNLVLPSLPYFGENDKSDAEFFKERGYEVAGDTESFMIDPVRSDTAKLIVSAVVKYGAKRRVFKWLARKLCSLQLLPPAPNPLAHLHKEDAEEEASLDASSSSSSSSPSSSSSSSSSPSHSEDEEEGEGAQVLSLLALLVKG
jgi:hypothetical protein